MLKIGDITGVILAGGRSSRFGDNKAMAPFLGNSLIQHVLKTMQSVFEEILLVTNTPEEYAFLSVPMLKDRDPYQGPLGAIVTALQKVSTDAIFAVACDMPLLSEKVIRDVVKQGGSYGAAVPTHDGIQEYLMALYSRCLLPGMEKALAEGQFSLKKFCRETEDIFWMPVSGDSWFNVNTREDLNFLEKHHAR